MLKICFVDDEIAVLERLKEIVDWESLDIQVAGAFLTPQEALDFLEREKVDIVISDISMPVINGIEFARRVQQLDPRAKIIFLTAYEDFAYAREAVRMGLSNYLIKPVSATELKNCVVEVCMELMSLSRQQDYISQLEKRASMSEMLLRDRFFQWLVLNGGQLDDQALRQRLAQHHLVTHSELFQVMVIQTKQQEGAYGISLYESTLYETIRHTLDDMRLFLFMDIKRRICLIIERPDYGYALRYDEEMVARKIRDTLRLDLGLESAVGCGELRRGLQNIGKGYWEAIYALEYGECTGGAGFARYGKIAKEPTGLPINPCSLRNELLYCLRSADLAGVDALLAQVRKALARGEGAVRSMRLIYTDIMVSLTIFLQEAGMDAAGVFARYEDPVMLVYEWRGLAQCDAAVRGYCHKIIAQVGQNEKNQRNQLLVKHVVKRIREELGNIHLSVHYLANEFYISEDHLNALFKSVMKTTLKRYIIACRMEHARELLSSGRCSVSQAARETGYMDALYFSKSYKKYFGISPSESGKSW